MLVDHLKEITHLDLLALHGLCKLVENIFISAEILDSVLFKLAHKLLVVDISTIVGVEGLPNHIHLSVGHVYDSELLHGAEEFLLVQRATLVLIELLESLQW